MSEWDADEEVRGMLLYAINVLLANGFRMDHEDGDSSIYQPINIEADVDVGAISFTLNGRAFSIHLYEETRH